MLCSTCVLRIYSGTHMCDIYLPGEAHVCSDWVDTQVFGYALTVLSELAGYDAYKMRH